jgi:hypothetical protein
MMGEGNKAKIHCYLCMKVAQSNSLKAVQKAGEAYGEKKVIEG